MKIIKEGTRPAATARWWYGLKAICKCGCEVMLEERDAAKIVVERRFNGYDWVEFKCPTCESVVRLEK